MRLIKFQRFEFLIIRPDANRPSLSPTPQFDGKLLLSIQDN